LKVFDGALILPWAHGGPTVNPWAAHRIPKEEWAHGNPTSPRHVDNSSTSNTPQTLGQEKEHGGLPLYGINSKGCPIYGLMEFNGFTLGVGLGGMGAV
jgi:hypothetical protein